MYSSDLTNKFGEIFSNSVYLGISVSALTKSLKNVFVVVDIKHSFDSFYLFCLYLLAAMVMQNISHQTENFVAYEEQVNSVVACTSQSTVGQGVGGVV